MKPTALLLTVHSWQAFRTLVAGLPHTKAKGDAFEHLCVALLRTDPRFVAELERVWLRSQVPPAVAARLNLPKTDEGIDGVAQTRSGEFWTLQCKYLDNPKSTLTKNALDGFSHLSFTYCKGVTKALVLHTSSQPIRKHHLLGISEVGLAEFEGLDESAWTAIHRVLGKGGHAGVTHKPRKPRPHQERAVAAITKHLQTHERGRVLMACGSGKSLVGFWVQGALGAKQVVVAVPSLALLNQTLREWATEWAALGQTVRFTAVCGDESATDIAGEDSPLGHAHELGIDTYTDTKRIAERLKSLREEHHVVFTTYQSSHRLAAAAKSARHQFDLGILDEAHKTVVERGGRFATLLDERKVRIRKRIAMTATERILKGADDRVLSMSNPKVYGEVAFSYTFKQAIADGVICDYKVVTLAVSESRMRELIAKNQRLRLHGKGKADRLRLARDLAAGELLAKAQTEYGVCHAISFHRNISAASGFADQWETVGGLVGRRIRSTAFHVSSKVPTGRRVELLQEFRQAPSAVVTNARCLTEGVDVPNVDAVLFADPRQSRIDIVQAVGRALRKNRDKPDKTGYVLLPVLVEDGQSLDEFLGSTAFAEIGRVLAVLSTHDERIAEEFRASEGGQTDGVGRESRVVFAGDVPVGVKVNAAEFADKCRARVWERVGRVNWRPFEEAREWVRKLGLQGQRTWQDFCAGRMDGKQAKPADIPSNPPWVYQDSGWIGWGDWLGTGNVRPADREFLPFEQAREWVRQLRLGGVQGWWDYCAGKLSDKPPLPANIPSDPRRTYKHSGWIGYGDWCGTGFVHPKFRDYLPFSEARAWVRRLHLRGQSQWANFASGKLSGLPTKPDNIPSNPRGVYKHAGWISWGDWLGSGNLSTAERKFLPFRKARTWVRQLKLGGESEWRDYAAGRLQGTPPIPSNIPKAPAHIYRETGWAGWGDWLGTAAVSYRLRKWRPFTEARAWVRGLGLHLMREWRDYCAGRLTGKPPKPADIPSNAHIFYADKGWQGWGDWLGTDWRPFTEARAWIRRLGLGSVTEWKDFCAGRLAGKPKKPEDIPTHPESVYGDSGWQGWSDWLGNGRKPRRSRKRS